MKSVKNHDHKHFFRVKKRVFYRNMWWLKMECDVAGCHDWRLVEPALFKS